MSFNAGELHVVIKEFQDFLVGSRLQKIYHVRSDNFTFEFYTGESFQLLVSVHPKFSRMHRSSRRFRNPQNPSAFCVYLRSRLLGARIKSFQQVQDDRIAVIQFENMTDEKKITTYSLVFELMGSFSNILLLDGKNKILQSYRDRYSRDRDLKLGTLYEPPKRNREMVLPEPLDEELTWNEWADKKYFLLEGESAFQEKKIVILRKYSHWKKKIEKRLAAMKENEIQAKNYLRIREQGELLKSNFSAIKKGSHSVCLVDYYQTEPIEIDIAIDVRLSPQENIQRYFKRSKKMERTLVHLGPMIKELEKEFDKVTGYQVHENVEAAQSINDLIVLEDKLVFAGLYPHPIISFYLQTAHVPYSNTTIVAIFVVPPSSSVIGYDTPCRPHHHCAANN